MRHESWSHDSEIFRREQAEIAYAFASKAVIKWGAETEHDIRLTFYKSFARFLEAAMMAGPTSISLLWEILSTLSSQDTDDKYLVQELLTMGGAVIKHSGLPFETVQSRLPRLFALQPL